jgi:beta-lactamase superfamily II metal-dependent hydrolase
MKIKFWKVGTGDAITIRYSDAHNQGRNIFVDSGFVSTYRHSIKPELMRIKDAGEAVDLWIITHTDKDHIGGLEAFIKDSTIADKDSLVKEFWFNWSDYSFQPSTGKISVAQGMTLREHLRSIGKLTTDEIKVSLRSVPFHDCMITILSPNLQSLDKSKIHWVRGESKIPLARGRNDYGETIEALSLRPAAEDTDSFNGGSIAFLLEWNQRSLLFLGDSHPSVVVESLTRLGYSPNRKLKVDFVKLSHHGSKNNTSQDLIQLLDTDHYIILAEGSAHSLPNKWTLANILLHPNRDPNRMITFYFNYDNSKLKSLFDIDADQEKYNFRCVYSPAPCLEIDLT